MIEAAAKLSSWLLSREAVARVARHLGCTLEAAERQIVDAGRGGRIKARGVVADQPARLPADWNGRVDLAGTTMRPPGVAYEITNLELCSLTWSRRVCCRRRRRGVVVGGGGNRVSSRAFRSRGTRGRGQAHRRPDRAGRDDLGELIGGGCRRRAGQAPCAEAAVPADTFIPGIIERGAPGIGRRQPKVVVTARECGGLAAPSRRITRGRAGRQSKSMPRR